MKLSEEIKYGLYNKNVFKDVTNVAMNSTNFTLDSLKENKKSSNISSMKLSEEIKTYIDVQYPEYADDEGYIKAFEYLLSKIEQLEKENDELKNQIEEMKCCGNCKHEDYDWDVFVCRNLKICKLNKYENGNNNKWELC